MDKKRVFIFGNRMSVDSQDRLRGISRYLDSHPMWDVNFVVRPDDMTASTVHEALRRGADGFLVDINTDGSVLDALAQISAPIVTIDIRGHALCDERPNVRTVCCDDKGVATTAARHFLEQGRFHSFAFLRGGIDAHWAMIRQRTFVRTLAEQGIYCAVYETRGDGPERAAFVRWLRRLPKPAAIMAVNDETAARLLFLAEELKLKVPNVFAVLGSDNDELICENTRPTLSSVPPNFEEEGFQGALLLNGLMRTPAEVPLNSIYVPVNPTIVRESTAVVSHAGNLIRRAQQFINQNACKGIDVDDVAHAVGISRRLLYLRFREIRGVTPFEAIRACQLDAVRHRLATTRETIAEITSGCGFENETHLMHLFKKRFGVTMRTFRKSLPNGATKM